MSNPSTPKRGLDVPSYPSSSDEIAFSSKRQRLAVPYYERFESRAPVCSSDRSAQSSSDEATSPRLAIRRLPSPLSQVLASTSQSTPVTSEFRDIAKSLPARLPAIRYDSESSQVSGNANEEEICFGMLTSVKIRVCRVKSSEAVSFDEVEGDDDKFTSLNLDVQNDRCDIFSGTSSVAVLNQRTHSALTSLATSCLRLTGLILTTDLKQKLGVAAKSPGSNSPKLNTTLSILVFGKRLVADSVARERSRHRLFLQHPNPRPINVTYENPQYLASVGYSFSNGSILPPIPAQLFRTEPETPELPDDSVEDLATVMDNLPQHGDLLEAAVDEKVTTTLLKHQKVAVNYVMRREGNGDQIQSLWRQEMSKSTSSRKYMHTITGGTSLGPEEPEDMKGGILADGMGLGKTLTMIASIVGSLARAEQFATSQGSRRNETSSIPIISTLVIVPNVLLLDGWAEEIKKHTLPGTLATYKYHGSDRKLSSTCPPYQVVISTYGTVAADFARGGGVLSKFHWYRLILDEAHFVRNSSTAQFKAVSKISASIRWCMSGTPVQNSLNDLGTLVQFLRVPLLDHSPTFRKYIAGRKKTVGGLPKPDYKNLKLLLSSVCLGRRISNVFPSLGVTYIECRPALSFSERRAYDELAMSCSQLIKEAVNQPSGKSRDRPILNAILKLRMFCNTGFVTPLVGNVPEEDVRPDELVSLRQQNGEPICAECSAILPSKGQDKIAERDSILYNLRCQDCIEHTDDEGGKRSTSTDDTSGIPGGSDDTMQGIEYGSSSTALADTLEKQFYPSKLQALLKDVQQYHSQSKSIVFSFWTRSLDLLGKLFGEQGIVFGRIDGNIKSTQRRSVLKDFYENSSTRVLLMTIGTGAVGLNNLSVANRVYILEPQWNPSIEDQAIGRVVRLGQKKEVVVVRYITKTTVEESIESRQILKVQLAQKGGLQYSEHDISENKRRIGHLQALGKIIESTILA